MNKFQRIWDECGFIDGVELARYFYEITEEQDQFKIEQFFFFCKEIAESVKKKERILAQAQRTGFYGE